MLGFRVQGLELVFHTPGLQLGASCLSELALRVQNAREDDRNCSPVVQTRQPVSKAEQCEEVRARASPHQ